MEISINEPANENDNQSESPSLTPTREATVDIIGGARQTDQLEQLKSNAEKHESGNQTTQVSPLEVNDGSSPANSEPEQGGEHAQTGQD